MSKLFVILMLKCILVSYSITRRALGDFLRHAVRTFLPLLSAVDHGYSEAIYLEDFEGNGIEVYHDKPVCEWDIRVKNIPDLVYYTEEANDFSVFNETLQKSTVLATSVEKRNENEVDITDNNGITVRVTLKP